MVNTLRDVNYRQMYFYNDDVTVFPTGWVLALTDGFMFCDAELATCEHYAGGERVLFTDVHHQLIVTEQAIDDEMNRTLWKQNTERLFEADENYFDDVEGIPTSFSPNGHYLMVMAGETGGNPSYPCSVLYDAETRQPLYEVSCARIALWLGDNEFLVMAGDVFHPFRPQQIDHIDAVFDREGIHMEPHWSHLISTSSDGRWYLWDLGGTALVVPVVIF